VRFAPKTFRAVDLRTEHSIDHIDQARRLVYTRLKQGKNYYYYSLNYDPVKAYCDQ